MSDAKSNTPYVNAVYLLYMDNHSRTTLIGVHVMILLKRPTSNSPNKIAIVITTAANWFSVRDDINNPIAMKHIPTSNNAIVLPIIKATFGPIAVALTKGPDSAAANIGM